MFYEVPLTASRVSVNVVSMQSRINAEGNVSADLQIPVKLPFTKILPRTCLRPSRYEQASTRPLSELVPGMVLVESSSKTGPHSNLQQEEAPPEDTQAQIETADPDEMDATTRAGSKSPAPSVGQRENTETLTSSIEQVRQHSGPKVNCYAQRSPA